MTKKRVNFKHHFEAHISKEGSIKCPIVPFQKVMLGEMLQTNHGSAKQPYETSSIRYMFSFIHIRMQKWAGKKVSTIQ